MLEELKCLNCGHKGLDEKDVVGRKWECPACGSIFLREVPTPMPEPMPLPYIPMPSPRPVPWREVIWIGNNDYDFSITTDSNSTAWMAMDYETMRAVAGA